MEDARAPERRPLWREPMLIGIATVAVVIGALVIAAQIGERREQDRRVDELYCTLSGVTPYDRGPKTGELCMDLL